MANTSGSTWGGRALSIPFLDLWIPLIYPVAIRIECMHIKIFQSTCRNLIRALIIYFTESWKNLLAALKARRLSIDLGLAVDNLQMQNGPCEQSRIGLQRRCCCSCPAGGWHHLL